WTTKSTRALADALGGMGHQVSHVGVGHLLHELHYSLQANSKVIEGATHPDRDAQFGYINSRVRAFLRAGDPVISVDTKKKELVGLADQTSLAITVCHFPPGTSKWNRVEHRLFAAISTNWRGQPLTSHEVIVNLIGATTNRTGLAVHAELDTHHYPKGIKI